MKTGARHRWSDKVRFAHKTDRHCLRCGLVKVTRHEPQAKPPHWTEFWRGLDRCADRPMPACEVQA